MNNNTGLNLAYNQVKTFQSAFLQPVSNSPKCLKYDRALARFEWMSEELEEFITAVHEGDLAEQADAMIDLIYFALGTLVEMGVKPQALFDIVQNANMAKLWQDGKPHFRDDGKVIKPDGWQDPEPELIKQLQEQINDEKNLPFISRVGQVG